MFNIRNIALSVIIALSLNSTTPAYATPPLVGEQLGNKVAEQIVKTEIEPYKPTPKIFIPPGGIRMSVTPWPIGNLYWAISELTSSSLPHHQDEEVLQYAEKNLDAVMKDLEGKLNIKFTGKPKLKHHSDPYEGLGGEYDPNENNISLVSGIHTHPVWDLGDFAAWFFSGGNTDNVLATIYHELGHLYSDQVLEAGGTRNWIENDTMALFDENWDIGTRLVGEGIGKYFECQYTGEKDNFSDNDWPTNIDDFFFFEEVKHEMVYEGGYHFVKPIMMPMVVRYISF